MERIIGRRIRGLALAMGLLGAVGVATPASGLFLKEAIKKAGTAVKDSAKKAGDAIAKGADKAKDAIAGTGKDVVKASLTGVKKLEKVFSKQGLAEIGAAIQDRVNQFAGTLKKAVETAIEKAKELARKWGLDLLIAKAKEAWNNGKARVNQAKSVLDAILKEAGGKQKLETLFKKVARRQFDGEVQTIVKWIASKITGTKIARAGRRSEVAACGSWPLNPFKSFSLTIGAQLSGITPKIVGGMLEVRFGVVADLGKDDDKPYDIRGYFHAAAGIGGGVPGVDAAANIMLSVSPGKTASAAGPFIGIFAEGGAKIGVEIEVEWSVGANMTAMPSIGLGVGVQDPSPGGAVMLSGGCGCTFTGKSFDCL